jgi:hypothetical protein
MVFRDASLLTGLTKFYPFLTRQIQGVTPGTKTGGVNPHEILRGEVAEWLNAAVLARSITERMEFKVD